MSKTVVYVVPEPEPSQTRGDWAVKAGNRILSHHRLKSRAVKRARKEAKKRNTYIRVQKSNGKYQKTIHPN